MRKLYDTSKFTIKPYDRLFCYVWGDDNLPGKCKFGQHFVFAGKEPNAGCEKRVKESMGVLSSEYKDPYIQNIYDLTDWAKDHYKDKFSKKVKFDDHIRPEVGAHQAGSEIHTITPEELNIRVNKLITDRGLAKPVANLNTAQYTMVVKMIDRLKMFNVLLLSLCARFGKTITSLIPALEMKTPLVIIASYVKTVHTSFKSDISNFKNFDNFRIVDTQDKDYQKKVDEYLKQGLQVCALVSLCNSTKRDGRIEFLMNKKLDKHLIVDEADYGAHKPAQAKILIDSYNKNKSNTKIMLMTGTNADRAMSEWPVDDTVSITYPELLSYREMSKNEKKKRFNRTLRTFGWDDKRDNLVCYVNFYQADYSPVLHKVFKEKKLNKDIRENPNLTAVNANPELNKSLQMEIFKSFYSGIFPELNIKTQTQNYTGKLRREMVFVNSGNKALKLTGRNAQDALNNYNVAVLTLSGALKYKGKKFKQENVEAYVKDFIRDNEDKNILIISNIMAQRSFSIPEIETLYLMYDGGQLGATIQKISRALTSGSPHKIANVICMSLDPNREDKYIDFVVESARSKMKNNNIKTLTQAMEEVLACMPVYEFGKNGKRIKLNPDEYLEKIASKNDMEKVFGRTADLSNVSMEDIMTLANAGGYKADKTQVFSKGKARDVKKMMKQINARKSKRPLKLAQATLTNIFKNLWQLSVHSNKKDLGEAIEYCINDKDAPYGIRKNFGVDINLIKKLNNAGAINQDHADVLINQYHYRQKEIIRKKTINE